MKKKLPWLKYDMEKAKYMEAKEQEKDAKKKLDEAAKTLNDLREPIEYDDMFTNCIMLSLCKLFSILLMTSFIMYGHWHADIVAAKTWVMIFKHLEFVKC